MKPLFYFLSAFALSIASPAFAADASNGAGIYASRCIACHSIETNRTGPLHRGVVGRKAGGVVDFANYSVALKKSKVIWNEKTLDLWLQNPEKFIPGQQMGYSVPDSKDRSDLIAYLRTQK